MAKSSDSSPRGQQADPDGVDPDGAGEGTADPRERARRLVKAIKRAVRRELMTAGKRGGPAIQRRRRIRRRRLLKRMRRLEHLLNEE